MLWAIFPLIITFIRWFYKERKGWDWSTGKYYAVYLGCLNAIFGFTLLITVGYFIGCILPKTESVEIKTLYKIENGVNTDNSYYLIRGYADEQRIIRNFEDGEFGKKQVIRYFTDGEFGKIIEQADCEYSYINQGYSKPYVEIHKYNFKYKWFWLFGVKRVNNKYVFFVPDNSIKSDYN